MSSSDVQQSTALTVQTVTDIAKLAKLSLDETQSTEYAVNLTKILKMMDALQAFDTEHVAPLKSPFDAPQPLREDKVTETNCRDQYQAVAPATQDGLYLVPRVIE
jgi:aspartyl-tRNA(Asn)/glutamyl-tRNA(Gln) amidotransferase subunit C